MASLPLNSIKTAYATASAGTHPSHTLPKKLRAIADAGFTAVEIAFPDLEAHATSLKPDYEALNDWGEGELEGLLHAARNIKMLVDNLGLDVLTVMPFSEYEGYEDENKQAGNLARARAWFKVLHTLGCTILQVGSTDDAATSSDYDKLASDLRELADEAASQNPPITIAYEMWAWGVHVNTWEQVWDIVCRVDRPNFGINLDTFQILARAYADPTSSTGVLSDAQERLRTSLERLTATFSLEQAREKIVYLQISDGSRKIRPEKLKSDAAQAENATTSLPGVHPLYQWSNEWRPLPAEGFEAKDAAAQHGGYLPVLEVCEAILKTGWRGTWSYEVFWAEDMSRDDEKVPFQWAQDAQRCHERLLEILVQRGFE